MNPTLGQIVPPVIGAIVGFLYYKFVGCPSGACPITANPYSSTLYGMLIGFALSTAR